MDVQRIPNTFLGRIDKFFHNPFAKGVVLIFCTIVALVLANMDSTRVWFTSLWHIDFSIGFEGFSLTKPLSHWINDALMAVFFFTVGLEIKRDIVVGELRSLSQASLPIAAAIGGMIIPALIYLIFNANLPETSHGWGIPMATDIAFALGILSIVGRRVPLSLKIFLTALAIADDIGAILVITFFYTETIDLVMLLCASGVFVLLLIFAHYKVYKLRFYMIPAIVLWILFLNSGVHATIAGVIVAIIIPATSKFSKETFYGASQKLANRFKNQDVNHVQVISNEAQRKTLQDMRVLARNTMSPVQRLEHSLNSTVSFFILPLFALCNAGIVIPFGAMEAGFSPVSLGIIFGLVVGKPLGITLMSYLVVKLKLATMPSASTFATFLGVACLGGVGFTMAIFVDNLAFTDNALINEGKMAILIASLISAILGLLIIRFFGVKKQ